MFTVVAGTGIKGLETRLKSESFEPLIDCIGFVVQMFE